MSATSSHIHLKRVTKWPQHQSFSLISLPSLVITLFTIFPDEELWRMKASIYTTHTIPFQIPLCSLEGYWLHRIRNGKELKMNWYDLLNMEHQTASVSFIICLFLCCIDSLADHLTNRSEHRIKKNSTQ